MPALIQDISTDRTTLAPGESFRVTVQPVADRNDITVAIAGVRGAAQFLQAPTLPGTHEVEILAGAPGEAQERRTVTIEVSDGVALPLLTIEHDPYQPLSAALRVQDPAGLPRAGGALYQWELGETLVETGEPVLMHDFSGDVDHTQPFTTVDVALNIVSPDGTSQSVRRSVTVWSAYSLVRQTGVIQPLVDSSGQANPTTGTVYEGVFRVRNIEASPVTFTSRQIEWLTSDLDAVSLPSAPEPFALTVLPDQTQVVTVPVDRRTTPDDTDGYTVHLFGTSEDGMPAHAVATFEFAQRRYRDKYPGHDRVLFTHPSILEEVAKVRTHDDGPNWLDAVTSRVGTELDERQLWSLGVAVRGLDASMLAKPGRAARADTLKAVRSAVATLHPEAGQSAALVAVGGTRRQQSALRAEAKLTARMLSGVAEAVATEHVALTAFNGSGTKLRGLWGQDKLSSTPWAKEFVQADGHLYDIGGRDPVENAPCDPDDMPDPVPDGWACQFTGGYEQRWLPGRLVNAKKGDIVLSPGGNGLIGGLLKQVTPAQRYSHTAIMTRNYYEVAHSTASDSWLEAHGNGSLAGHPAPSDGFEPKALKYLWPGGVIQTTEEGYRGSDFTAPDGKVYNLKCFGMEDTAQFGDRWELIPAMVVKPHPSRETTTARQALHLVAERARSWCVTGPDTAAGKQSKLHYRFYCYSDAGIAQRLDPATGRPEGAAPDEAGWPGGTVPTVCSSMVWLAAREAGLHPEGPGDIATTADLEPDDVQKGAQVDGSTADGLYLYTAQERREAAEWLHTFLANKITKQVAAEAGDEVGAVLGALSDIADDCANQIINTFASDWSDTDAKDSTRWRDATEGRAVSPDNLMFYDAPGPVTGMWGYMVPANYRAGRMEQVPVTTWKPTTGPGKVTGLVRQGGAPASNSEVNVGGTVAFTGDDGRFTLEVLEGRYSVHVRRQVPYGVSEGRSEVTVKFHETTDITVDLADPPEVYRELVLDGTADGNDDEGLLEDDENMHEGVHLGPYPLGPYGTHAEFGWSKSWGGEVRAEFDFKTDWQHDNAVTVHVNGRLYEGASETTNDLDGTTTKDWRIGAGETQVQELYVHNDDEDENTWCRLVLHITNRRAP